MNNEDKMIKVWPFYDAPKEYQEMSKNGGDEDWVAFVPAALANTWIGWLEEGQSFGCCSVDEYVVDGGVIKIGSHA